MSPQRTPIATILLSRSEKPLNINFHWNRRVSTVFPPFFQDGRHFRKIVLLHCLLAYSWSTIIPSFVRIHQAVSEISQCPRLWTFASIIRTVAILKFFFPDGTSRGDPLSPPKVSFYSAWRFSRNLSESFMRRRKIKNNNKKQSKNNMSPNLRWGDIIITSDDCDCKQVTKKCPPVRHIVRQHQNMSRNRVSLKSGKVDV